MAGSEVSEGDATLADVYKEAVFLLGARSVLDLTVDAGTPEAVRELYEAGENASDIARQLVDDGVIR